MQNYITSFSASKSSQFVNDRLTWDEGRPHRHDCHDPPHGVRVGFIEDRPPPRRLARVARSDPWKVTGAQVDSGGMQLGGEDYSWLQGQTAGTRRGGKDCPRRDLHGEDCHSGQQIYALPVMEVAKSQFEAFAFTGGSKGYSVRGPLYAALI